MVIIQPSVNCLVNLTEVPSFVLSLSDIEHVHFERITFQSKNFDMVLVFKDFTRDVAKISAIPTDYYDMIGDWINDNNITMSQGPASLKWPGIMTAVRGRKRRKRRGGRKEVEEKRGDTILFPAAAAAAAAAALQACVFSVVYVVRCSVVSHRFSFVHGHLISSFSLRASLLACLSSSISRSLFGNR